MTRLVKILAGLTTVFVLLGFVYAWSVLSHGKKPYAHSAKAARLSLTFGAQHVELKKNGNEWMVETSSGSRPAEPSRVENTLSLLAGVDIGHVLSESPETAALFEVNEAGGTRVTMTNASGKIVADGIFGKQSPDFSHFYFRYPNRPAVYLATGLFRGELTPGHPEDWLKVAVSTSSIPKP